MIVIQPHINKLKSYAETSDIVEHLSPLEYV